MTQIIDAIDDYIDSYLGTDYVLKTYGFCELMKKTSGESSQPIPVTIPARLQVSIDDRFDIITWIRLTEKVQYEDNPDWSFGKKESRFASMQLRIVFANKVSIGENIVFDFIQNLPSKLSVPDYQFVFISSNQVVDPDHENIYETELGNNVYERHRFPWNIYAIDLTIQFIICEGDFRITEDGGFRVLE